MTVTLNSQGIAPIDILLVGLGSIGTVYGYMLEKSGKARVTAVARSNYNLYSTTGVTLNSEKFGAIEGWKPYRVVKSQAAAFEDGTYYTFAIVCTKSLPDVLPTSKLLEDTIASGKVGAWSLIQNGLGVEEDLYEAVKHLDTPIISSLAWIGVMTSPSGDVVQWRGVDTAVSGIYSPVSPVGKDHHRSFTPKQDAALALWVEVLSEGGANIRASDRIDSVRFSKNVWNCAWSSIQGLVRTTPACFLPLSPELHNQIKLFITEIVTIGFKSGLLWEGMPQYPGTDIAGSLESVVENCWTKVMTATARAGGGHKMSLLIDVEMGRPIEVEVIVGAVLKVAKANNVSTPLLDFVYVLLKGVQVELVRQQKLRQEVLSG